MVGAHGNLEIGRTVRKGDGTRKSTHFARNERRIFAQLFRITGDNAGENRDAYAAQKKLRSAAGRPKLRARDVAPADLSSRAPSSFKQAAEREATLAPDFPT